MRTLLIIGALIVFNGCATRSYVCKHHEEIIALKKENIKFLADLAICKMYLKLDIAEDEKTAERDGGN